MRLLNVVTLEMEEFERRDEQPEYAILSHTWGPQKHEVNLEDMRKEKKPVWKKGFFKVLKTCAQAKADKISHVWIDSCCIDRSNITELSESINSMYRWYENAKFCYVFLEDVHSGQAIEDQFVDSRWFTRGWTLQELLAPRMLIFFTSDWNLLGTRFEMADSIEAASRIDPEFLGDNTRNGIRIREASVAQRMSWASARETSKEEDAAYYLLGIFGINMPLIYGEGMQSAFLRLQEEILRQSDDQSIFAWMNVNSVPSGARASHGLSDDGLRHPSGVLAPSPKAFSASRDIISIDIPEDVLPCSLTSKGVRLDLRCLERDDKEVVALIPCRRLGDPTTVLAIRLIPMPGNRYKRLASMSLDWVDHRQWSQTRTVPAFLVTRFLPERPKIPQNSFLLRELPENMAVKHVTDGFTWTKSTKLIVRKSHGARRAAMGSEDVITIRLADMVSLAKQEVVVTARVRQLHELSFRGLRLTWKWCQVSQGPRQTRPALLASHLPYFRRTWAEGSVLYAEMTHEDVFGEAFYAIDVFFTSRFADILLLRLYHLLNLAIWVVFKTFDLLGAWRVLTYWEHVFEFAIVVPAHSFIFLVVVAYVIGKEVREAAALLAGYASFRTPADGPNLLLLYALQVVIFAWIMLRVPRSWVTFPTTPGVVVLATIVMFVDFRLDSWAGFVLLAAIPTLLVLAVKTLKLSVWSGKGLFGRYEVEG